MKIRRIVRKQARVEMIPLIDSMFLLLVFFIYAMLSMVVHKGVPMRLPTAVTTVADKKDYQSISISPDGGIYYDRDVVSLKELGVKLNILQGGDDPVNIFINADVDAKHGRVMDVLDLIRSFGIDHVSFETKSED